MLSLGDDEEAGEEANSIVEGSVSHASVGESSVVSTACSEMFAAIGLAARPGSSACHLGEGAVALPMRPLFPLRPQFYREENDNNVRWLVDEVARAPFVLHVTLGRLAWPNSELLGCRGPTVYTYVLDGSTGKILLNENAALDEETPFRHSSFVAGRPVAAAGELTVDCGVLKAVSNRSGHYEPPPSCLQPVMDVLSRMGVVNLGDVELELIKPVAGTARYSELHAAGAARAQAARPEARRDGVDSLSFEIQGPGSSPSNRTLSAVRF